jgi:hypothetical protein
MAMKMMMMKTERRRRRRRRERGRDCENGNCKTDRREEKRTKHVQFLSRKTLDSIWTSAPLSVLSAFLLRSL